MALPPHPSNIPPHAELTPCTQPGVGVTPMGGIAGRVVEQHKLPKMKDRKNDCPWRYYTPNHFPNFFLLLSPHTTTNITIGSKIGSIFLLSLLFGLLCTWYPHEKTLAMVVVLLNEFSGMQMYEGSDGSMVWGMDGGWWMVYRSSLLLSSTAVPELSTIRT